MKTNMTTPIAGSPCTTHPSIEPAAQNGTRPVERGILDAIQSPLVEGLNAHCSNEYSGFYLGHGYLRGRDIDWDYESLIEAHITGDEGAFRVIAALLRGSASQDRIGGDGPEELRPMWSPVFYSLMKRIYGTGRDEHSLYIHCVPHEFDKFTESAAREQVAALAAWLSDPRNIVQLTAEERARM